MTVVCSICKDNFVLDSKDAADKFIGHISKCPLKSNNKLQERFTCSICKTSFQLKKSFVKHIFLKHVNIPTDNIDIHPHQDHNERTVGKYFIFLITV